MFPLNYYPSRTPIDFEHKIVAYCAEEVRRQRDTQWHVYRMYDAWMWAIDQNRRNLKLSHALIREIGARIDEENWGGYRNHNITVGGDLRLHWGIHSQLSQLLEQQDDLDPDDWYYAFELIHPFADGNGRTGKVLYNWLRRSLEDPVWPKDFFGGIENP